MAFCPQCGVEAVQGASFCEGCGGRFTGVPRVTLARSSSRGAALLGGGLAALGCLLPFQAVTYTLPPGVMPGGKVPGVDTWATAFVHQGAIGVIVLVFAVLLGAFPMVFPVADTMGLVGFGLSAFVLGMVAPHGLGAVSFSTPMGVGMSVTPGIGFYALVLGYLILAYIYMDGVRKARKE